MKPHIIGLYRKIIIIPQNKPFLKPVLDFLVKIKTKKLQMKLLLLLLIIMEDVGSNDRTFITENKET